MRLLIKILAVMFLLGGVFVLEFEFWGDDFQRLFDPERCAALFGGTRTWGWALGIALLVSDILLPVPATGIMAALGAVYGFFWGTVIATAGSAGAAITGYALAKYVGRIAAHRIASREELSRFTGLFERWGGAAIIFSRAAPVLPEVMTVLAGLAGMGFRKFLAAVFLGTLPTCALFAWVGHASRSAPLYGILLSVLLPLLAWPLVYSLARADNSKTDESAFRM